MDSGPVPLAPSASPLNIPEGLMKQENLHHIERSNSVNKQFWEEIRMANNNSSCNSGQVNSNNYVVNVSTPIPLPIIPSVTTLSSSSSSRYHPGTGSPIMNPNLTGSVSVASSGQHHHQRNPAGPGSTISTPDYSSSKSSSHSHGHQIPSTDPLTLTDQFIDYANYQQSNLMQQKKKGNSSVRDPLSHRIIEKRRRDRMNNCLADLARLLPQASLRKGRGRIEKTEIVELAIRHLKHLSFHKCEFGDACEYLTNSQTGKSKSLDSGVGDSECESHLSQKSFTLGYEECFSECLDYLSSKSPPILGRTLLMDLTEHLLSYRTQSFNYNNHHFNNNTNSQSNSTEFSSRIDELINRIKNSSDQIPVRAESEREQESHFSHPKETGYNEKAIPRQQESQSEENGYDYGGGDTSCCSSPVSLIDSSCDGGNGINNKPPIPTIVGGSSCKSTSVLSSSNGFGSGSRSSDEGSFSSNSVYSNEQNKYTKFKNTIQQRFINQETVEDEHLQQQSHTKVSNSGHNLKSSSPMVSIVNFDELREPEDLRNIPGRRVSTLGPASVKSPQLIPGFVLCEKGLFYIPITIDKSIVDPYFQALAEQNEYLESTKLFPPLHPITINVCFLLNSPSSSLSLMSNNSRTGTQQQQQIPTSSSSMSNYTNSTSSSRLSSHSENPSDIETNIRRSSTVGEDLKRAMWTKQQVSGSGKSMRKRGSESMSSSQNSSLGYWSSGTAASLHNYPFQQEHQVQAKSFSPLQYNQAHLYSHGHGPPLNPHYPNELINLSGSNTKGRPLTMKSDGGHGIRHGSGLKKPKRIQQ